MRLAGVAYALALMGLPTASWAQAVGKTVQPAVAAAEPSADALALAKMLGLQRFGLVQRTTAAQMKQRIEQQLLSSILATRGPGCDPYNPECRGAAERIANAHAAPFAQALNDAIDRGFAGIFQAKMSQAEIRSTIAFFRTDAGRAFAGASFRLDSRDEAIASVSQSFKFPGVPFDEFYEATKQLPRRTVVIAPPASAPPPPAHIKR